MPIDTREMAFEKFAGDFEYDPETGIVVRLWKRGVATERRIVGTPCDGYLRTMFKGEIWLVHRIAWLLFYKANPPPIVDHRNGNGTDNRLTNIREATHTENMSNRSQQPGRSGKRGVIWHKAAAKWQARIMFHRKNISFGLFHTLEEASVAYEAGAKVLRGDFMRDQ